MVTVHHPIAAAAACVSTSLDAFPLTFTHPDPPQFRHRALHTVLAKEIFTSPTINHIYNEQTGKQETMDSLLAGPNATTWCMALSNEIGRLAKGINGRVTATKTIDFIHRHVPCKKRLRIPTWSATTALLKQNPCVFG